VTGTSTERGTDGDRRAAATELADAVKRTLGDEAGLTLMEMLPPVGWADVATKQDLERAISELRSEMHFRFERVDERFEALEHKLMGAFHKEMTAQTWRLVTAATAMFGLFAVVARI
jgi:hypothetical protein